MPRKKKVEENKSISLFSDDDIIKSKKAKNEIAKTTKHKAKIENDDKNSSIGNSNNKSNITNKNNKNSKSTGKTSSKKCRNSAAINDKSKSNTRKNSKANKINGIVNEKIAEPKIKVGRRDRKHNYMPGHDQIWIDGIDHWVSKTAFRNENKINPVYNLDNYVQGLDSYWVMNVYRPENIQTESDKQLQNINTELKRKYKNWQEVSMNYNLPENIIDKYKDYIYWLIFLKEADFNNKIFNDKFKKKYKDKFSMYLLMK